MPRAAFVYDDAMSQHVLRQDHPMRPVRLRHTFELLDAYGAFDGVDSLLVTPTLADETSVGAFHSRDYMAAVRTFSLGLTGLQPQRFGFAQGGDNPTYPGMYEAAMLSAGATLTAARMVADGEVLAAFNISGGLHHAAARNASGFCVFNDPVVAIMYLLQRGLRVAYVDIDAHHGDGVQDAFYGDPRVLTISVHESGQYLFPGTGFAGEVGSGEGVGYAVNLPLYPYTDDEIYLEAFEAVGPPLIEAFAPDVLLTQLGIDTYHTDPLTHLADHQPGVSGRRDPAGWPRLSVAGHRRRRIRHWRGGSLLDPGLRRHVRRRVAGSHPHSRPLSAWAAPPCATPRFPRCPTTSAPTPVPWPPRAWPPSRTRCSRFTAWPRSPPVPAARSAPLW